MGNASMVPLIHNKLVPINPKPSFAAQNLHKGQRSKHNKLPSLPPTWHLTGLPGPFQQVPCSRRGKLCAARCADGDHRCWKDQAHLSGSESLKDQASLNKRTLLDMTYPLRPAAPPPRVRPKVQLPPSEGLCLLRRASPQAGPTGEILGQEPKCERSIGGRACGKSPLDINVAPFCVFLRFFASFWLHPFGPFGCISALFGAPCWSAVV